MITGGLEQAHDEIFGLVQTIWDAGTESAGVLLMFEDVSTPTPNTPRAGEPANAEPWARASLRIIESPQIAHGEPAKYETNGFLQVEIRTPAGDGQKLAHKLGTIVQDGLRGAKTSPGQVWFRRPVPNTVGQDATWFQVNVIADFTYYEVT